MITSMRIAGVLVLCAMALGAWAAAEQAETPAHEQAAPPPAGPGPRS